MGVLYALGVLVAVLLVLRLVLPPAIQRPREPFVKKGGVNPAPPPGAESPPPPPSRLPVLGIREGTMAKGGRRSPPITPRPAEPPRGQRP